VRSEADERKHADQSERERDQHRPSAESIGDECEGDRRKAGAYQTPDGHGHKAVTNCAAILIE
jgi:hypothetical protein